MQSHVAYSFYLATTATGCSQHVSSSSSWCRHAMGHLAVMWRSACIVGNICRLVLLHCSTSGHTSWHTDNMFRVYSATGPKAGSASAARAQPSCCAAAEQRLLQCRSEASRQQAAAASESPPLMPKSPSPATPVSWLRAVQPPCGDHSGVSQRGPEPATDHCCS